MKKRKGQFQSQIGFIVFSIMFFVLISFGANLLSVDGISCTDPSNVISEPSENSTNLDNVLGSVNGLVDVFFGCSSSDQLVNGLFTALKAGMILIFLTIIKDLVPFT